MTVFPFVVLLMLALISFLNMVENFHHYWRAYGGWSFVMKPYYDEGKNFQDR